MPKGRGELVCHRGLRVDDTMLGEAVSYPSPREGLDIRLG